MSQELDAILASMSRAGNSCFDLNGNGNLPVEEQTIFFQFGEHIVFHISQITAEYDAIAEGLANDVGAKTELDQCWLSCNDALDEFNRSMTAPKLRTATANTAFAIDRTSTHVQAILA